jgi:hypothetical protein
MRPHLWYCRCSINVHLKTRLVSQDYKVAFAIQRSAEHRKGLREESRSEYIRILKYRKKYQKSLEISQEFLSGSWQY